MIPPCDSAILESNPQFKKLYQQLTTTLLNPDGSTCANDTQPQRQAVLEDLKNCRVRHAKWQIKKQALRRLAFDLEGGLSDEYRNIVAIVMLYLDTPRGQTDRDTDDCRSNGVPQNDETLSLLAPDIHRFYADLPMLITPLSNAVASAVNDLRSIASADSSTAPEVKDPSRTLRARTRRPLQQLSSQLGERLRQLRQVQFSELPVARRQMVAIAAEVLATRAQVMERTVVLLERAKHGALARTTKAKAEHLATVAQGVEGKLSVMKLDIASTIYNPEAITALTRYQKHLKDTLERLGERRELALEELGDYEEESKGSGSGPLADIARRYGGLIREMETISMDIARLEK